MGNLLTLTEPEQNTTTSYVYDNLGRMIEETNQLDDTRYFVYNAVGLLVEKTDRDGWVTTYEYDSLYRILEENWLDEYEQLIRKSNGRYPYRRRHPQAVLRRLGERLASRQGHKEREGTIMGRNPIPLSHDAE